MSLVSEKFTRDNKLSVSPSHHVITPLGGTHVKQLGEVEIVVSNNENGETPIQIQALVVEKISSDIDVLLGWPDLVQHGISISSTSDKTFVTISNHSPKTTESISMTVPNNIIQCQLRNRSKVTIPSNSQVSIKFKLEDPQIFIRHKMNKLFLFPSNALLETKCLKLACGELTASNKFVLLANLSNEEVTLDKGSLLGYLSNQHNISVFAIGLDNEDTMYLPTLKVSDDDNNVYSVEEFESKLRESTKESKLSENKRSQLINILKHWNGLFSKDTKNPGATTKTKCHVNVEKGTVPIRSVPYRTSPEAHLELRKQVDEMLKSGIIRKSNSPWAFPVVLAIKAD